MERGRVSPSLSGSADAQKLQRLGFVQNYSEAALNKSCSFAGSVYSSTRGYVPTAIEDQVSTLEGKVTQIGTQYGAPLVNSVQDKSQQFLGVVDHQVDSVAKSAGDFYEKNSGFLKQQSDFHSKNLAHFKDARDAYLRQAKDAVAYLQKNGLGGSTKHAVDQLVAALESARSSLPTYMNEQAEALLERVNKAWDSLYAMPAVQKALEAVSPSVEAAKQKYIEAHNTLVKAPIYDSAVKTSSDVFTKVSASYPYQTAANKLYPFVSPIANPVVDKASPYVTHVMEHMKPQHTI